VVVGGAGRMKLDGEIVEVKKWGRGCASRPVRGEATRPGRRASRSSFIGAPNLGDNPRDDVEGQRDWWAP